MQLSSRTLQYRAVPGWKAKVCFVWYACDDVFQDSGCMKTVLFVGRFTSFFIVELGMALVVFCTVVSAREVVPVLGVNSVFLYHFLIWLIIVVTFNILFNYVCANTFSCRIGVRPRWSAAAPNPAEKEAQSVEMTRTLPDPGHTEAAASPLLSREEAEARGNASDTVDTAADAAAAVVVAESRDERQPRLRRRIRRSCRRAGTACAQSCCSVRQVTQAQLAELDRLAAECDQYTPRERRYKVLDEPRRFCIKCNRLKAPREHHCAICGVCVPKMDHHCPWINSCVDAENLRYFFLFLMWLTIGTFLDSTILGYGFYRQRSYEKAVRSWKANGANQLVRPTSPFGYRGSRMTAFPVVLTIVITGIMFLCLAAFLYATAQMVLSNTTAIEQYTVADKQELFRSTSFVYHNPYDLGPLRNFIEAFRTRDDPVVRDVIAFGWTGVARTADAHEDALGSAVNNASGSHQPRKRGFRLEPSSYSWAGRLRKMGHQALLVSWLLFPPSIRAGESDGIHYPTFYSEALAGQEETALV